MRRVFKGLGSPAEHLSHIYWNLEFWVVKERVGIISERKIDVKSKIDTFNFQVQYRLVYRIFDTGSFNIHGDNLSKTLSKPGSNFNFLASDKINHL